MKKPPRPVMGRARADRRAQQSGGNRRSHGQSKDLRSGAKPLGCPPPAKAGTHFLPRQEPALNGWVPGLFAGTTSFLFCGS